MKDTLTIVDNNNLRYEGRTLWADVLAVPYCSEHKNKYTTVSAEELEFILRTGRAFIEAAITSFYAEQRAKLEPRGYTVIRPSIFVAQLGSSSQADGCDSRVYTRKGYDNGAVHWESDEQLPKFANHWEAVEKAGFYPHVRGVSVPTKFGDGGGSFLMLRDDDEER